MFDVTVKQWTYVIPLYVEVNCSLWRYFAYKSTFNSLPFCFACSYEAALEMVASGRVDVKPLITHTFRLEEALCAFQTASTGEGGAIKVRRAGQ